MLLIIFLLFLFLIVGNIVIYSIRYRITPTPTSNSVKRALLKVIPDNIQGEILELGSGWGTLAFSLAQCFPQCGVIAYEISPIPWLVSYFIQSIVKFPNLKIIRRDFFLLPLSEASLVICYLYPNAMTALKSKFEHELLPGTLVITHTFAIPGWTPLKTYRVDDLYQTPIYIYKK